MTAPRTEAPGAALPRAQRLCAGVVAAPRRLWEPVLLAWLACLGVALSLACLEISHAGGRTSVGQASNGTADECRVITATDVKTITGMDVFPIDREAAAAAAASATITGTAAAGTASTPATAANDIDAADLCLAFATMDGASYLGVRRLASRREYEASVADATASLRAETRDMLSGVGDEAVLMKWSANRRRLVARKGDAGIVLLPSGAAPGLTDRALHQLAIRALARLP